MTGFLGEAYIWVKALHIIFVIFWMAGLFMMPRFFAYHVETDAGSPEIDKWVEREARLQKIILNPSMIVAWLLGLMMAADVGAGLGGWFHVKLLLVLALSGFHGFLSAQRKKLAAGNSDKGSKFWRMVNEVPGVVIILVVLLAVVKPF